MIGIGFYVLEELTNSSATDVTTVYNETLTTVTETGEGIAKYDVCGYQTFSIVGMTNKANNTAITSGNWTTNTAIGKIYGTGDTVYNNTDWNVTYTYTSWTGEGCGAINTTIGALKKIPTWLGIIVILAIVGILLAIVFNVLPGAGGMGGIRMGGEGAGGEVAEV